ncbi:hypothetical protein Vadar_032715 [Vaccinium darrowii]|uniref:Uncharacterized protein n=1 Tax=Vaccinium darrowii TaxID=229202 RepID=A0ACB7XLH9_9ERIC|nr:hypothetical protein Vadar_032715 [Vaccinium darrowii]
MDEPLLSSPSGDLDLITGDGDYRSVKNFRELKSVFWIETAKLWKISGPIVVTILCQYGTNSVTSIFVGHIGDIELSAVSISLAVIGCFAFGFMLGMGMLAVGSLSICMNINGYEAMLFVGINAAISVRVSNELGLGHPRAAKYSVYVTVFQSFLMGIVFMVLILATRNYFAVIFTSSEDMQQAVAKLAYLLGITMVLNSVQPVISGVAVGGGWQALVAYINLGSYYVFGLPFGYVLGYVANLGVQGLWLGMIAGTALQTLILLFVLYKTNWNNEAELTSDRMKKWGGQDINTDNLQNNIMIDGVEP